MEDRIRPAAAPKDRQDQVYVSPADMLQRIEDLEQQARRIDALEAQIAELRARP
jgi:hypothetical protein